MNVASTNNAKKNVVIIGGGFAGVNLAQKLLKDDHYHIILVDKNNYNFFPPLVYQIATAFLEPSNISYPFRKLFRGKNNIRFHLGEFVKVDPATHTCVLNNADLVYDYLVFAVGTDTNYFGNDNVRSNALPMKTVNDAIRMRNTMLQRLEMACFTDDLTERKKLTTFVIAGGGPTGVEIAGMLAEVKKFIIRKDYPELDNTGVNIYLVDGGSELLGPMSKKSQADAYKGLSKLGVTIQLNIHVKDFVNDQVTFKENNEILETKTLIWAAGVTAKVIDGIPTTSFGRGKRALVDAYNKVIGVDDIYAIGDTCFQTTDSNYPEGHPQVAQVAMQQGKNLAKNFSAMAINKPLMAFKYTDRGTMAIIGRNKAVADLPKPKLHFHGFLAWFMWLFVHLISLINYRNRIRTLYNWTVAYFTRDQSLRMIIRPDTSKPLSLK